jgi:hypothetical protein
MHSRILVELGLAGRRFYIDGVTCEATVGDLMQTVANLFPEFCSAERMIVYFPNKAGAEPRGKFEKLGAIGVAQDGRGVMLVYDAVDMAKIDTVALGDAVSFRVTLFGFRCYSLPSVSMMNVCVAFYALLIIAGDQGGQDWRFVSLGVAAAIPRSRACQLHRFGRRNDGSDARYYGRTCGLCQVAA